MNELIEGHLGYAHAIAAKLAGKYPPNITRADLEAAAEFGLVQAASSFDPSRSVSFATFAYYRIRGAIFDEVRKSWHASHLRNSSDRDASEELAEPGQETYASPEKSENSTPFLESSTLISLDSTTAEHVSATTESPVNHVLKKEECEAVQEAIRQLPKRHQFVLRAHYYEELSLAGIGERLNLSKSWVSRIHAQALAMLRKILRESASRASSRRRRNAMPLGSNLLLQVSDN